MKCYYAHCTSIYNTPQEHRDVEELEKFGLEVVNPNQENSDEMYEKFGMDYFINLVKECDVLIFRALITGEIPAGVAMEIAIAEQKGLPVLELPNRMRSRTLDVTETREYLRLVGQR